MTTRAVAFDLDGTLADTVQLTEHHRRNPNHVLSRVPPGEDAVALSFGAEVSALPALLVARGYQVAIVTRAPPAYAATLSGLLGLDYHLLVTSADASAVDDKLRRVCDVFGIAPDALLYVGDQEHDRAAAYTVGCQYREAPGIAAHGPKQLLNALPTVTRALLARADESDTDRRDENGDAGEVDAAETALRDGQPDRGAHEVLEQRGYLSVLREFGDVSLVHNAQTRAAMEGRFPPWTFLNDADWREILRTGDVGRCLDVPPDTVKARLPDRQLDRVLDREARRGAFRTNDDALSALPASVRTLIQRPARPTGWLEQLSIALRQGEQLDVEVIEAVEAHSSNDPGVGALAYLALMCTPGQRYRKRLQMVALCTVPPSGRSCVVKTRLPEGWFWFSPSVLTRHEFENDADLQGAALEALGRLFPLQQTRVTDGNGNTLECVTDFGTLWGDVIRHAKNWQPEGRSGPEVMTSLLDLPSAILAHHVHDEHGFSIVAVPASPRTDVQPGEASNRLGRNVARLARHPFLPALSKRDGEVVSVMKGFGRGVILIEDQVTYGTRLLRSVDALRQAGFYVHRLLSWSASSRNLPDTQRVQSVCWLHPAALQLGLEKPCEGCTGQATI